MDFNITDGVVNFNGGVIEIIAIGITFYIGWTIGNITFDSLVKPQLDKIFNKNKIEDEV